MSALLGVFLFDESMPPLRLLGELVAPALYGWSIVVVSGVILLGISG